MAEEVPGKGTTTSDPWTPPKCYIHVAPDGTFEVVDEYGKPFPTPPLISKQINGGVTYTDPWGNEIPPLYPPPGEQPEDFVPPQCYVNVAADGSYEIVDKNGDPIPSPPAITKQVNGDTTFTDPWGNEIPPLYPPAGDTPETWPPLSDDQIGAKYYIVDHGHGHYDLYDKDGVLVPRGPGGKVNYADLDYEYDKITGTYRYFADDGSEIPPLPQQFSPPECYVHVSPDGSFQIVDKDGNLLPSPPTISKEVNGDVTFTDPWGNTIDTYYPPAGEPPEDFEPPSFFVHVGEDGTLTAVDSMGEPLNCQPEITGLIDGSGDVSYVDPWGNEIMDFHDPLADVDVDRSDIYIHVAADGTFQVVDEDGELVPSPPNVTAFYDGGALVFHDTNGNEIDTFYPPPGTAPEGYEPPECYVHLAPDGSYQVVDASGNMLPSPPMITPDFHLGKWTFHDPWGNEIPTYYPPAGAPPTDWPPKTQDDDSADDTIVRPDDEGQGSDGTGDTGDDDTLPTTPTDGTGEAAAGSDGSEGTGTPDESTGSRTQPEPTTEPEPVTAEAPAPESPPREPETVTTEAPSPESPPGEPETVSRTDPETVTTEAPAPESPPREPETVSRTDPETVTTEAPTPERPPSGITPDGVEGRDLEAEAPPFAAVEASDELTPVLPTPLSAADAVALAEGVEPAVEDLVGTWEPPVPEVEVSAEPTIPVIEVVDEHQPGAVDEITDRPTDLPADLVEVPSIAGEPAARLPESAEPTDTVGSAASPGSTAGTEDAEPLLVDAAPSDPTGIEPAQIEIAEPAPDPIAGVDQPIQGLDLAEFEQIEVAPIDVEGEIRIDLTDDDLLDEPEATEMAEIDDIELLDLDDVDM